MALKGIWQDLENDNSFINADNINDIAHAVIDLENVKGGNGTTFTTDETLSLENGVLSVNTAKKPELDNTLPITSAAVAQTVGNIEILLKTI